MNEKEYIILRKLDPVLGGLYKKEPDGDAQAMNYRIDTEFLEKKHIADLQNDPKVIGLAPPMPMKLVKPVSIDWEDINHPGITWGVSVTRANDSPFTGSGVTVAVLDTGIDASHEAFRGIKLIQKDFTGEGNGDAIGHGTHCAGTIFGQTTADKRFGIARGIKKVLIGKVLGLGGRGDTKQVVEAITWAIEKGAHIISMSLGFDFPGLVSWWVNNHVPVDLATSRALEIYLANIRLFEGLASLIRARGALFQGTLLLAAAGNESKRNINPDYELRVSPPASANGIISVGALKTAGEPYKDLSVADFSNIGPDIAAPGVGIYSAKAGGGYVTMSGTSMATPHAAGIAALWAQKLLEESGRLNISELTARLIGQASKDQLAAGYDPMDVGAGLVLAPLER